MTKSKFMPSVVLGSICIAVALLLSVINMFTAPIIEAANDKKANAALLEVLPDGEDFETLDISGGKYPSEITAAYRETSGKGYVFQMTVTGYKSGLVIMCGIDADGKITGATYIASNETLSAEVGLGDRFVGFDKETISTDIIAGPTAKLTTEAYYRAIEAALNGYIVASGGSVDLRDPEQILNDSLNAALGTEGKTFEKWFAVEELTGVDAIYISDAGQVVKVGEEFVGFDLDSSVVGAPSEAAMQTATAALDTFKASKLNDVVLPEGTSRDVLSAKVTDSGNYVLELRASGYGKTDNYGSSGEYIKIKVAISADGKIISTLTTYQNESKNIGDACADPSYYEQYNGKDAQSVDSVSNISGATITSTGYKKAIKLAFETVELIKGGAANG